MSHDEQHNAFRHASSTPAVSTAEPDPVERVEIDECPVCSQPGRASRREAGAGTTITHPRRVFPCSTSTPLEQVAPVTVT